MLQAKAGRAARLSLRGSTDAIAVTESSLQEQKAIALADFNDSAAVRRLHRCGSQHGIPNIVPGLVGTRIAIATVARLRLEWPLTDSGSRQADSYHTVGRSWTTAPLGPVQAWLCQCQLLHLTLQGQTFAPRRTSNLRIRSSVTRQPPPPLATHLSLAFAAYVSTAARH